VPARNKIELEVGTRYSWEQEATNNKIKLRKRTCIEMRKAGIQSRKRYMEIYFKLGIITNIGTSFPGLRFDFYFT
jgi:hypothetical protein